MWRPFSSLLASVLILVLLTPSVLPAQTGAPDPVFAYDGPPGAVTAVARTGESYVVAVDAGRARNRKRLSQLLRLDDLGRVIAQSAAFEGQVKAIGVTAGGDVIAAGAMPRGIARFDSGLEPTTDFNITTGANRPVNALLVQPDGRILLAGKFTRFNGARTSRLVRLLDDGSLDATFAVPAINGSIEALALTRDDKILVVGTFTSVQSTRRRFVARLNADGTLDSGFVPPALNGPVAAVAVQSDGGIVIGGRFTRAAGITRSRLARLNTDGSLDDSYNAVIDKPVRAIGLTHDNTIVLAGDFTTVNGATARGLARLSGSGAIDATFEVGSGADGRILALFTEPTRVTLGGSFNLWNGTPQHNLVRLVAAPPNTEPGVVSFPDEANLLAAIASSSTVTFACDGVLQLSREIVVNSALSLDAAGRAVVLSGRLANRHIRVMSGASFTARGLAFADGRAVDAIDSAARGGSVLNDGGHVVFVDCVFTNNSALGGSANGAAQGGAIWSSATVAVTNCTFIRNSAIGGRQTDSQNGAHAAGGAIWSGDHAGPGAILPPIEFAPPLPVKKVEAQRWVLTEWESSLAVVISSIFVENVARGGAPQDDTGSYGHGSGGAVSAAGSWFESHANEYRNNLASGGIARGGAIEANSGGTSRRDTFAGNTAAGAFTDQHGLAQALGGAVFVSAAPRFSLIECSITNNSAVLGNDSLGGGVYSAGTLAISETLIAFNRAIGADSAGNSPLNFGHDPGDGVGAGIASFGAIQMTNVTVAFNTARGGEGSSAEEAFAFYSGQHGLGGGLFHAGAPSITINCTIANNVAIGGGGARPGIGAGGGIHATNNDVMIGNSILSANAPANVFAVLLDLGSNLSSDASANFFELGSQNDVDPLLGPLGDNGGRTWTMALLPASPAIDAADETLAPSTDQRGFSRPAGGGVDVGAFER